ncbi:rRNA maturation RNase YbeY [Alkalicoccus halolimnae]|uniref:Endoribonuclease YbeY n=1 Tax=Alkalicoccus halolimnae TaxID=1667239 RepID=A0A5C7F6U9_9BACI|nr:rRNA maturation RNase YbeY [Alkalicoccus halolimnae]TXF86441.1 rRNA maturation RNase YbeY [Alkalicoccus halolimnae]
MNEYEIDITDETGRLTEEQLNLVSEVLQTAFIREGKLPGAEVSVTFVRDENIQTLNRDYRNKNQVTDVLSFALNEGDEEIVGADIPDVMGDIIISADRAEAQAEEYGHSFEREICFLAVHGFLHLSGYVHESETEEKEMFTRQEEILRTHGIEK